MSRPNYDVNPITPVAGDALRGWEAICAALPGRATGRFVVELYPGADKAEVIEALTAGLRPDRIIDVETFFRSPEALDAMLSPYLGDDPVFGKLNRVEIADFLDPHRFVIAQAQAALPGLSLVVGAGASIVCPATWLAGHCNCASVKEGPSIWARRRDATSRPPFTNAPSSSIGDLPTG